MTSRLSTTNLQTLFAVPLSARRGAQSLPRLRQIDLLRRRSDSNTRPFRTKYPSALHPDPSGTMGEAASEAAPFSLTEADRWVLSQTDEEFRLHDWDELREIVGMFGIQTRPPSS